MLNISFWNIAFTIINVLVLLLFMRHFLMKPVMEILEQRKQMVEKDLDAASTAKSQAEALKTSTPHLWKTQVRKRIVSC